MSAQVLDISRRRFIASGGLRAVAVCLLPHPLFGNEENMVAAARKAGETASVTVQGLCRNISALIGSGGNIAVLPGDDGKLIIDSAYLGALYETGLQRHWARFYASAQSFMKNKSPE